MSTPESICQQFAGKHYRDRQFRQVSASADWTQVWPEIDRDGDLTGRLIGDDDGFLNVDDEAVISTAEARAGGWTISDGYAEAPQPIDVELATANETIRHCAVEESTGLEHPAMEAACQAYHSAVAEALAGDPRAKRLNVVSPKGQRILHSQWCGAHFSWTCGAMGVMSGTLTDGEKAALDAADDAGLAAAKAEVDAEETATAEPTRQQIATLQDEAAAAGDEAMASICAAALDGDPVALAAAAQCISDAAAQRDS